MVHPSEKCLSRVCNLSPSCSEASLSKLTIEKTTESTNISAVPSKRDRIPRDQKAQDKAHIQDTDWRSSTNRREEISHQESGMDAKPLTHYANRLAPEDDSAKHPPECRASEQNSSSAPEIPEDEATSNALNATRPARRQRSVVSYAEPNLRDKMRRPTNEFADAVMGGNPRRVSNIQSPHPNASDERDNQKSGSSSSMRSSYHFETTDNIQNHSFEAQEEVASGNSMTTVSQRKRKTLPASSDGPSVEAVALTYPTRHCGIHSGQQIDNEDSTASLENGTTERNEPQLNAAPPAQSTTRQARRHSSNPRGQSLASESGVDSTDSLRINPAGSLALDYDEFMLARSDNASIEAESCAQSMNSQTGVGRAIVSGTNGRQARRGQRTGTRRKSMMI